MATKIYPNSQLIVAGYVQAVEMRGNYATLVVEIPSDSYTDKIGNRREVPAQIHKFDVPESFMAAIAELPLRARVTVAGKGTARAYADKVTGEARTFTSFRLVDLKPCNDLPELAAPAGDDDVPF